MIYIIYYAETIKMREMYPDELSDGWSEVTFMAESKDFNPFDDSFMHEVCRSIMDSACRYIAEDVIPEFNSEMEVDKNLLMTTAKNLDRYKKYPFDSPDLNYSEGYYISDKHHFQKIMNSDMIKNKVPLRIKEPNKDVRKKGKGRGL